MTVLEPRVTVVTFSGHRQPDVQDSHDFRSWAALAQRLGPIWCIWAGPPLRSQEGALHVIRRLRHAGVRSLLWVARAVPTGVRVARAAAARGEVVVLNGAEPWGWLSAWLVSILVRRPWVMDVHADYLALPAASVGRWRKAALKRAIILFAHRATVRRVVAQPMVDALQRRNLSATLLPSRLQPVWELPLERAQPPLTGSGLTILAVGRLVPSKGYDLLLHAIADVVKELPKTQVRVIGDGPERRRLEALIIQLDLSDNVALLGSGGIDEVRAELARADIFIISSRDEGLPRTLLEAAAAGVPIVATAVGGIPAAAAVWTTVLLVPVDANSLATGVRRVLASPPDTTQLAAVRDDVLASYGFEPNLDALASFYRGVSGI